MQHWTLNPIFRTPLGAVLQGRLTKMRRPYRRKDVCKTISENPHFIGFAAMVILHVLKVMGATAAYIPAFGEPPGLCLRLSNGPVESAYAIVRPDIPP